MKSSELAIRYAKAIYELAVDHRSQDKVFNDLRALSDAFESDPQTKEFLTSPLISIKDRVAVLENSLKDKGLSKEVYDLVILLAKKDRFALFSELVLAFQDQADSSNNVCRGVVRSATALGPEDRKRVEDRVESVLKKKVIMTYKVDPTVIGGLVAQVGSYTFDDSISAHLRRMNEELKRRTV